MSKSVAAVCIACLLAGCGLTEPNLESFAWSRDSLPPPEFSQFDEPIPAVGADGKMIIHVWSTTYARQNMSQAQGWIEANPSEVTLCFAAPDYPPSPPSSGSADAAAAYLTLLTYKLGGEDDTSSIRFGGACNGP